MRAAAARQSGATLLAVLVLIALMAAASSHVLTSDSAVQQRQNEAELLYVGEQYRSAIESYRRATPRGTHTWPTRLEQLVSDDRFPMPRRHLRKLFADPMAPYREWALIKQGDAILGVYSTAPGAPFRKTGFSSVQQGFGSAQSYAQWQFKALTTLQPPQPPPPARPPK